MSHSLPPEQHAELMGLIQALHENCITPEESARLERWLCRDEEARWIYVQYMNLYATLSWDMARESEPAPPAQEKKGSVLPSTLGFLGDCFQQGASFFFRTSVFTLLVAIGVPGLVLFVSLMVFNRQGAPENPVAFIAQTHEAIGSLREGPASLFAGMKLTRGDRITLQKGLLEIKFNDGAKVIVQGPSTFEIQNSGSGFLKVGRLVANVPKGAEGFTVGTPSATIVDLGTEFGVSVNKQGVVEGHVFKGTIQVAPCQVANAPPPKVYLLKQGQAARISREEKGKEPKINTDIKAAPNLFVQNLMPPPIQGPKSSRKLVFSHRGGADPLTEGWKILYRGKNANVKQDTPDLVPVKDGDTDAWMMDNRIPQKMITYHSNRKSKKGGLTQEMYELGQIKGWSLRVRLKAGSVKKQDSSFADTSAYFWFNDGEKMWGGGIYCLSDGTQCARIPIPSRKGNKEDFNRETSNSRDRYIEYEIRYHPATKDAEVFIDGKLVLPHFAGAVNDGYKKTGERGIDFGLKSKVGMAKFALVEWKVLDETDGSEQRRGD